jgi:hypothetical protein
MTYLGRYSSLHAHRFSLTAIPCAASLCAILLPAATIAAQNPLPSSVPGTPLPAPTTSMSVPAGYSMHSSVDMGGRIANTAGSDAMYSTLVNLQSGPRVSGQTFELRALPGNKNPLVDSLKLFSTGYGGDPNLLTHLDFYKGKLYEFSGVFRRDRSYFDYDLLANPNIPGGQSIPIGSSTAPVGQFAWPQVLQSPVLLNTVRRMTDTKLTILPLAKVSFRFGYSQNVFEGPSLSPGYAMTTSESALNNEALLQEYLRDSSDDWTGAVEWKPFRQTHITFEEQVTHIKADSFFTLAPSSLIVQEADGTRVAVGNYYSQTPGIGCNTSSMVNPTTILYPAQTPGGLPIIDPACDVISSYLRSQPTRFLYSTESLRFQSSSIRNLTMTGDVRYTQANMNMPNYYENFEGLAGAVRSIVYTGAANAHRDVFSADYGVVWQVAKNFSLSDQVDYNIAHQPGVLNFNPGATLSTPTTAGHETINYNGPLTPGTAIGINGTSAGTTPNYFGQKFLINNLVGSWDATSRVILSLGWRHTEHDIQEGIPALASTTPLAVSINENTGIFTAALRPANNWSINGSIEAGYADNVLTPVAPRQTWHYRIRTQYKPRPWATVSGTYNDLERHNNTNNVNSTTYFGPLDHVDHSRVFGLGAVVAPNEHYEFDISYAYSDVYTATNICYTSGATATLPGTATVTSSGAPNICPQSVRGSSPTQYEWYARDFQNAPTNFGSAAITLVPTKTVHASLGYRISAVDGSRFFTDARDVNGSLNSKYQSPYVNLAWTFRNAWTWKAGYDFYGYGEGGPSGPENCSTSSTTTSTIVPCTSLPYPTGLTETSAGLTAPRNFHASNVTLGLHYEF